MKATQSTENIKESGAAFAQYAYECIGEIPDYDYEAGVAPRDTLPAEWYNWLWNRCTAEQGHAVSDITSMFNELLSILTKTGTLPDPENNHQIYDAIAGMISAGAGGAPVGTMLEYAGSSAPTGYLMCDGSAVSRTTYASLFNVIGTTYGAGDGSTTFNVPDRRETVAVGVGQSTRSGITTHDVYTLGQFKDDQSQGHKHNDSGHLHTDAGHSHTDSGHTHTDSGHTHTDAGHAHSLKDTIWSDQQWIPQAVQHPSWHLNGNANGAGSSDTYGAQANIQSSSANIQAANANIQAANANIQSSSANITGPVNDETNGTPRTGSTTHGKQFGVNYIIKY